jgi:UPF0716 protein FxsA
MFGMLVLLFLVVPIIELYLIVQVASGIGVLETLGLLILVSLVGAWLVRAQGLGVLARIQGQLNQGKVPGTELVDGLLVLFAGALMLTPGFMTDALGLLLLIPPTRAIIRTVLVHRYRNRVEVGRTGVVFGDGAGAFWTRYDRDDDDPTPPPIELGPGDG